MDVNQPLVSVCIPTYNHEKYISQCLDGVLMQKTEFPIEIIVGEDDSKDNTRNICKEYAEKYPEKIRLFLRKREDVIYINGKATGRFNFISNINASKGKYLAFCEGDDYWTDEFKLQKQIDFMESNPDYSICFHNAKVIWEDKDREYLFKDSSKYKDTYHIEEILGVHFMPSASLIFRMPEKLLLPDWFSYVGSGDIALTSIFAGFGKAKYIDEAMSVYRKHPGGISRTRKGWTFFLLRIVLLYHLDAHYKFKYKEKINKLYQEVFQTLLFNETTSGRIIGYYYAILKKGVKRVFKSNTKNG